MLGRGFTGSKGWECRVHGTGQHPQDCQHHPMMHMMRGKGGPYPWPGDWNMSIYIYIYIIHAVWKNQHISIYIYICIYIYVCT